MEPRIEPKQEFIDLCYSVGNKKLSISILEEQIEQIQDRLKVLNQILSQPEKKEEPKEVAP